MSSSDAVSTRSVADEGRVAGGDIPLKEKVLGLGAKTLQSFHPINQICQTVCGLHCYAHDGTRQVEAHHFCSHITSDMRQCVIYDSNKADARLIGIEYIISRKLFETLPMEERKYWHSHSYEVKSGMLVAPGIPTPVELVEMQSLVDTYGKTWHLWQVDLGHELPLGPAQLMMSFTEDGQVDKEKVAAVHAKLGYNTEEIRKVREERLKFPETHPEGADPGWNTGKGWQAKMVETEFKRQ